MAMAVQATGSTQEAESIQELEPVREYVLVTGSTQETELAHSVVVDARLIESNQEVGT
ncbi:hypothetical protein DPMN_164441 [Dreissena polymorpha]|uniref:Uncharacterized protein n=1 Tax=Dreissena polymorpha TaxID=45954 RepID=A0A9D4IVF1_DREPO|nr:hypothetical protein DPMN_164441 [Dreissena polymorpha]